MASGTLPMAELSALADPWPSPAQAAADADWFLELRVEPQENRGAWLDDFKRRVAAAAGSATSLACTSAPLHGGDFMLLRQPGAMRGKTRPAKKSAKAAAASSAPADPAPGARPQDDPERTAVAALFERKTVSDMLASAGGDGRYPDQYQRMSRTGVQLLYWLIISSLDALSPAERHKIEAARDHLNTFRGMHVVFLRFEDDLVEFFVRTARYVDDNLRGGKHGLNADLPLYRHVREAGKRERLDTQRAVWLEQLNIPYRVGRPTARAIAAAYPSVYALLAAYTALLHSQLPKLVDGALPATTKKPPPPKKKRSVATAEFLAADATKRTCRVVFESVSDDDGDDDDKPLIRPAGTAAPSVSVELARSLVAQMLDAQLGIGAANSRMVCATLLADADLAAMVRAYDKSAAH